MVLIKHIYQYQLVELHQWNDTQTVTYFHTQKELAEYLKVNGKTLYYWLKDKQKITKRRDILIFKGKYPVHEKTKIEYSKKDII